jgi:hypothetical protein
VNPVDVERPKTLFDQLREIGRKRRLLDVVFALEQIDGIGVAGGDLLTDVGGSAGGHDYRAAPRRPPSDGGTGLKTPPEWR